MYKKILHIVDDNPVSIALAMRSYLEGKNYFKPKHKKLFKKNWENEAKKFNNFLNKIVKK